MTVTANVYVDTSALLKRWLGETGSSEGARIFDDPHQQFITSHLTVVEMTSAVNRGIRMTEISAETGSSLLNQIFRDMETFIAAGKLLIYPMNDKVVAESVRCLRRCANLGLALRSLDAIHIATALTVEKLGPTPFITADTQQIRAAQALGLTGQVI